MNRDSEQMVKDFLSSGKPLVIGLGNIFMSDDAAGMAAIQRLSEKGLPTLEAGRSLLESFYKIDPKAYDRLLIIDAAEMGISPGELLAVEEQEIFERGMSTHENNLSLSLSFYRAQNKDAKVLYLGLQYGSMDMSEGVKLTPEMEEGVERVVSLVAKCFEK